MSVYKRPTSPHYHFDFRFKGRRFHGSTGCVLKRDAEAFEARARDDAEAQARQEAAAVQRAARHGMTILEACTRYGHEVGRHHPRPDQTLWSMTWLIAALGQDRLVSAIADRDVAELVARRRGEAVDNKAAEQGRARARAKGKPAAAPRLVRPSTVNRSVTEPLRKVLNRARDVWNQDVQRIDWRKHMLKEPQERVRELKAEEEERLFAALPAQFHAAVRFTLRTGCRLSETVLLPWSAVDWGARAITIHGKGDKKAPIPMTARVRELLWPLQGRHDERVFAYANGQPLTVHGLDAAWGRALAKAGITDFRFHDLRHTTATRLLRQSGNLKMVQRLLRHEDITTTARYAHVLDEDLRAAMEDVEQAETAKVPTEIPTKGRAAKKREV